MNTSSIATPVRNTTTKQGQRIMTSETPRVTEIIGLTAAATHVPPLSSFHERVLDIYREAIQDKVDTAGKTVKFGMRGISLFRHIAMRLRQEGRGHFVARDIELLVETSQRIMEKLARVNAGLDSGYLEDSVRGRGVKKGLR